MKGRVFTFFLGVIILWVSLSAYGDQTYASDDYQFRASGERVALTIAVAPKFRGGEQGTTERLLATIGSVLIANAYSNYRAILYTPPSIHKSVKAYIVFRVLRN